MEESSNTPATVPPGMNSGEEAAALAFTRMLAPQETTSPDEPEIPETDDLTPAPEAELAPEAAEPDPVVDTDEELPQDESDPVYEVTVAGKVTQVPLSELVNGYSREADYTRKTMALSTDRKAAEKAASEAQEQAKVLAERTAEYEGRLVQLKALMKDSTGEPDWEDLQENHPDRFADEWAKWQVKETRRKAVEAEHERVKQEQTTLQSMAEAKHLAHEQEQLLAAVPEWKDSAKAQAELTQMVEYGKSLGFSPEELGNVTNHRLILLLRDGARYRQLATKVKQIPVPMSKQAKAPASPAAVAVPTAKRQVSELTRARQRLAKTGAADDAAPIFLDLLQRERAAKGGR